VFGYFACVLFVGALLLIERIDEYIPQALLFTGAPFALVSILAALLQATHLKDYVLMRAAHELTDLVISN